MEINEAYEQLFGADAPIDLTRLTALQDKAVDHFFHLFQRGSRGAVLSTPTGTGKTRVMFLLAARVLAELDRLDGAGNFALIITTATAKWNTQREGLKWLKQYSPKDFVVIDGDAEARAAQYVQIVSDKPRFIISNYDVVSDELPFYQNLMNDSRRNAIFPDEADNLQNPTSGYSVAVRALCKRWGLAMTATPVSNRANSAWALLDFSNPGNHSEWRMHRNWNQRFGSIKVRHFVPSPIWSDYTSFTNLFCKKNDQGYITGSKNMPELHRRLQNAGLVEWDKYKVLGIKPFKANTPMIDLTPDQRKYYDARAEGVIQWLETTGRDEWADADRRTIVQNNMLAIISGMKRACALSPIRDVAHLVNSKMGVPLDMKAFRLSYDNAKADWAAQFIQDHWQEGVFLWSQWGDTLQDIMPRIHTVRQHTSLRVLDSSVSSVKRLTLQDEVQSGKCKVLLATPAGGASLNFHALTHCIIFDLPWRARDLTQAIGRIERAGMQKDQAQVWFPAMNQTIETKRLVKLLDEKAKDSTEILTGERGRKSAVLFKDIDEIIAML